MIMKRGTPKAESRSNHRFTLAMRPAFGCLPSAIEPASAKSSATTDSRRGLTLIELLVTIVILVTLLAAVLPAISPNNEGRKIREAARQLTSLFSQAQAQAARDGRSVGVGFSDWNDLDNDGQFDPGESTGVALEAFIVAEPAPFAGFDQNSTVVVSGPSTPGVLPQFNGLPLVQITFGHGAGIDAFGSPTPGAPPDLMEPSDWLPPGTFRPGDIIEVGTERFQIALDDFDAEDGDQDPDVDTPTPANPDNLAEYGYLRPQKVLAAFWLNRNNRVDKLLPQGGRPYHIRRRPLAGQRPSRTATPSVQFPRGIGIDMDPTVGNTTAMVMFSPTGAMDAVYVDGRRESDREPTFILLGRSENAIPWDPTLTDDQFHQAYAFTGNESDDEVEAKRRELNMLNADSRWIVITPAGRVVGAENYVFDPRQTPYTTGDGDNAPDEQFDRQREGWRDPSTGQFYPGARFYAQKLENETGG